jgi:hypothetical protein
VAIVIDGRIITITSAAASEDGKPHAIIDLGEGRPRVLRYIDVVKADNWTLDEKVRITIEGYYDLLLDAQTKGQVARQEADEMNRELDELAQHNARYRFPKE